MSKGKGKNCCSSEEKCKRGRRGRQGPAGLSILGPTGPTGGGSTGPTGPDGDTLCDVLHTNITPCEEGDTIFLHGEVGVDPSPTNPNNVAVVKAVGTDVSLALTPTGTGAFLTSEPDGTAVGGNVRGANAVDLQMLRTAAIQVASGDFSAIGGGNSNMASGLGSTVGGGFLNTASSFEATVSGGFGNMALVQYSTVGGGISNTASGNSSTVGGGGMNTASGLQSTIAGGSKNSATGNTSTVGGGVANTAFGVASTVAGGNSNSAGAQQSTISGGSRNTASGPASTVGGGIDNSASGIDATVGGGASNFAIGDESTVSGGNTNAASGADSVIAGGVSNAASGSYSVIGGGQSNTSLTTGSTVAGGRSNRAEGQDSTVGGGFSNTASGNSSTVAGGFSNTATNIFSTIPGGVNGNAVNDGTFVWNATQAGSATTNNTNQVVYNLLAAVYTPSPSATGTYFINGDLRVTGDIFGASKSFFIDHPLDISRTLQHFCTEAPTADLIYRGIVQLENGQGSVDIDASANMTAGTFEALTSNPQVFLTNDTNFDLVKVQDKTQVGTGVFTIVSSNADSSAEISWLVVAERRGLHRPIENDK